MLVVEARVCIFGKVDVEKGIDELQVIHVRCLQLVWKRDWRKVRERDLITWGNGRLRRVRRGFRRV